MTDKPEFDEYADSYDELHRASIGASGEEPSFFASFKAEYVGHQLAASPAKLSILDFGCGVGNSIPHLRKVFPAAALFGADPSAESIALAKTKVGSEAELMVTSASALPYPAESFDVVFVACVFHHIAPDERLAWMRELKRVIKKGGSLFVFEHNMLNPLTLKAVRDCPFDENAILLPRSELLRLSAQAGFARATARYIIFFPRLLAFLRWLEPWLGRVPFGAQYVVRAAG